MKKVISKYRLIIILIIFNSTHFTSQSQNFTFFEMENLSNLSTETYFRPQINLYSSSFKNNSKIGVYFFALVNENWGQAYGGMSIKATDWLTVNVGAGLEVNDIPYRFNVTLKVIKNKFFFIQIYEYGGSGFWYHILANYEVFKRNYFGVVFKRYYGLGIDYEYQLKNAPLRFTFSPLYDFEDSNYKFLMALRYYL